MAFGKSQKDPFGTALGHLIERATFGAQQTEEWGQFMHIFDLINTTEEGPKDAIKALKKRLSKNCNHREISLTLSLLDMCVQNCGQSFHVLVVRRDFCKDKLVKLLNPRYNLPVDMQERILSFIMTWARGFQGTVDVSEVKEVYLELLKKGVQFPSPEAQKLSSTTSAKHSSMFLPTAATITLVPEQIGKLYSELDMAKMNVQVMSAILKENVPGSENPDDMDLLQKLYKTCRVMQERLMELLGAVQNEDVITELIQVNENLNSVLLGHERLVILGLGFLYWAIGSQALCGCDPILRLIYNFIIPDDNKAMQILSNSNWDSDSMQLPTNRGAVYRTAVTKSGPKALLVLSFIIYSTMLDSATSPGQQSRLVPSSGLGNKFQIPPGDLNKGSQKRLPKQSQKAKTR
uniref:Target of myb1 like 1 membrane trafficking protein n=1 Tax=Sphenodon punctatus TaxID=8508 RepID=A0A8D0H9E5_SPHPU